MPLFFSLNGTIHPSSFRLAEHTKCLRLLIPVGSCCIDFLLIPRSHPSIMSNSWPPYRTIGVLSLLATAVGLLGLWVCRQIQVVHNMSEREFMANTGGTIAIWSFSFCFILGLFVLFPIALRLQERSGAAIPGPKVPDWLAWPFRILMIVGIGIIVVAIIGIAVTHLLHKCFQNSLTAG